MENLLFLFLFLYVVLYFTLFRVTYRVSCFLLLFCSLGSFCAACLISVQQKKVVVVAPSSSRPSAEQSRREGRQYMLDGLRRPPCARARRDTAPVATPIDVRVTRACALAFSSTWTDLLHPHLPVALTSPPRSRSGPSAVLVLVRMTFSQFSTTTRLSSGTKACGQVCARRERQVKVRHCHCWEWRAQNAQNAFHHHHHSYHQSCELPPPPHAP